MRALIYKDFLGVKKILIFLYLLTTVLGIYFIKMDRFSILLMYFVIIPIRLISALFEIDNNYLVDRYLIASGFSRRKIVISRYVFLWLITLVSLLISLALIFFLKVKIENLGLVLFISILIVASEFISLIEIPLMYKLGANRTKQLTSISYLLGFAIFILVGKNKENLGRFLLGNLSFSENTLAFAIVIFIILLNLVSLLVSFKIFDNKEV
ncbi:MAG: ABC-2 transporter permease [Anaerococcus sp.]|uniref:ABC-2 transporter permease n=1 Tax=Anaerococcus sp. TaxID=1872515 RepID=UPI002618BD6B|nr:ABC-2 transporter permease [Anaerococcus sp.]MCI5971586.1 ABC-2 transporter permease [Anaerococcus sp.]MDD6919497.1 ABC-2 transporter permease [Peptoniphilaceae bacterium]MDY2927542.1 ABC-2 transporter permease [Anaerococcus sp.]